MQQIRFNFQFKEWIALLFVAAIGLAASTTTAYYLHQMHQVDVQNKFRESSDQLVDAVRRSFERQETALRGLRAVVTASHGQLADRVWRHHVASHNLEMEFPGVLGFAFVRRVSPSALEGYLAVRQQIYPDFKSWGFGENPGDRFILEMIEPLDANRAALGADLASEPLRRDAALRAMRRGEVALTPPITLAQAGRSGVGFLFMLPCYRDGLPLQNEAQREKALIGWVNAPVLLSQLAANILAVNEQHFDYEIFAGKQVDLSRKLYDHDNHLLSKNGPLSEKVLYAERPLRRIETFVIGGQALTFVISHSVPSQARDFSLYFFMGGLIITLLSVAVTFAFGRMRKQALVLAASMSRSALESENQLNAVINNTTESILSFDQYGHILSCNCAAEKLFGYIQAEILGLHMGVILPQAYCRVVSPGSGGVGILAGLETEDTGAEALARHHNGNEFPVELTISEFRQSGALRFTAQIRDISEKKRQEEEKSAIQQRLQIALEAAGLGIWELWPEREKLVWAPSMHVLYGTNPKTFRPDFDTWSARIHPEDLPDLINALDTVFTSHANLQATFRVVRADGSLRYMACHGRMVDDPRNGLHLLGVNFDITGPKKIELSLRQSEERFSLAAEAAQEGIWDWDLRTGQIWFSPQWKAHLGYADHELANNLETWSRLILPDDQTTALNLLDACSSDADSKHESIQRFRHKDGHIVYIRNRAVHIKDASGFVTRMVGSHEDITEKLQQQKALQESQERLDLAINSAHLETWDWDLQADQIVFGGSWEEIRGLAHSQSIEASAWLASIHPDDLPGMMAACQAHWQGESAKFSAEFRMSGMGGWKWVQAVGQVVAKDEAGKPLRMLGVLIDIDERKRNEEALQIARRVAEEASRTKSEFLANMSHEIRTPLNAVIGFSTLLADADLNRQQAEFVDTIRSSGDALLTLINDLLDFSKIEAGKLDLESLDFDVRNTLEDTLEIVTEKAAAKGLNLACLVEPGVPARVIGDPARLRQILLNLLNNAVKFTDAGEVVARARAMPDGEGWVRLHVAVSDTGIGIAPETMARLFSPFTQADASTTRRFGGTGLGLSICKRLAEAMGGAVGVESRIEQGSTFWFEVRLRAAPVQEVIPALPLNLHGKHVLVVDDYATNCELLRLQLAVLGLEAETYEAPQEALLRLRDDSAEFVLAIIDMQMPQMNGLMLAEAIRALPRWQDLPLVLLTSLAMPGQAAQARAAHFSAYLAKPVRQAQLLFCVQEALRLQAQPAATRPFVTIHTLAERLAAARPHLLLAEDNQVNQKVAVLMLEKIGCRVDVVDNGRLALEAVQLHDYALVLMDCQMPEMDGYTATEEIRKLPGEKSRIPIVAMTANAFKSDVERCMSVGMNGFVSKPVSPQTLRDALLPWLKLSEAPGEAAVEALPITPQEESPVAENTPLADELTQIERAFAELEATLGLDMRDELLGLFWPTLEECLNGLDAAFAASDANAVYKCAHKLKGSSGQLGAKHLSELAKTIEHLGREGKIAEAAEWMPQLREFAIMLAGQFKGVSG